MRTKSFVAIDLETATPKRWSICQMGLTFVVEGVIKKTVTIPIKPPNNKYFWMQTKIHGLTYKDTLDASEFPDTWERIYPYIKGKTLVAHNAAFEKSCFNQAFEYHKMDNPNLKFECTYKLTGKKLSLICEEMNISLDNHHDAGCDAAACANIYLNYDHEKKEVK